MLRNMLRLSAGAPLQLFTTVSNMFVGTGTKTLGVAADECLGGGGDDLRRPDPPRDDRMCLARRQCTRPLR